MARMTASIDVIASGSVFLRVRHSRSVNENVIRHLHSRPRNKYSITGIAEYNRFNSPSPQLAIQTGAPFLCISRP